MIWLLADPLFLAIAVEALFKSNNNIFIYVLYLRYFYIRMTILTVHNICEIEINQGIVLENILYFRCDNKRSSWSL